MKKDEKLSDVLGTLHKLTSAIFSDAIQRKLILDNLTEAVFTVDKDLKITSLNKQNLGQQNMPTSKASLEYNQVLQEFMTKHPQAAMPLVAKLMELVPIFNE